ncbi:hypothetical protein FA95DRAFT_1564695 [Auriscalpium vulgare]|uniref:Uncharacterized protein n=1 Tax=Auriscalpium vulgare TaxID=40419 RepID=A0ACB8RD50_9AGAM|nr:hypothetical protein FA95DRAFT_1564695 [Auriscalpium vulgare]
MPVVRASTRRRRSSLALLALNPHKAEKFISAPVSAKGLVTFAPNVTPVTYVEPEDGFDSEPGSPTSKLFPPSAAPASAPSRKRCPPGKRRSQGYIPRPPNAFMLFRADFVRQKHVPGTIETNHGSLSKIIGNCWRALPLDEKRVWEIKAKHAKAEHKTMYPNYRFRPVHNKNKEKKTKAPIPPEDEQRCEDVAQLLLEGMKGEQLAAAVKKLDHFRSNTPAMLPRRPSSVPLPHNIPIGLPQLDFPALHARPQSPGMDAFPRYTLPRRPSSAGPAMSRAFVEPFWVPRAHSPLPEVNADLFEKPFLHGFPATLPDGSFNFNSLFSSLPGAAQPHHELNISPLDNIAPNDAMHAYADQADPYTWQQHAADISGSSHSDPSSIYSGSPAPSDMSLPLHAPQPQRAFESWTDAPAQGTSKDAYTTADHDLQTYNQGLQDMGIAPGMGLDIPPFEFGLAADTGFSNNCNELFAPEYKPEAAPLSQFDFHDMIHEF